MKITVTKTITVQEDLDSNKVKVLFGGQKDIDSNNFEIYYNDQEVAFGHYNNKSRTAHVSILDVAEMDMVQEYDLVQFFEAGIENGTLLDN